MATAGPAPAHAKTEGLGLGGILLPQELGGSGMTEVTSLQSQNMRRSSKQRIRHSPSLSSPPSLAPFANSLGSKSSTNSLSASVPTASRSRKSASFHQLSGDVISYPVISRVDAAPTYIPPATVPPIPADAKSSVRDPGPLSAPTTPAPSADAKRKISKSRPPPIKVSNSTHSSFLSPFRSRFGKEKETTPEKEKGEKESKKEQGRRSKVDSLIAENQAAIAAALPSFAPSESTSSAYPDQILDISLAPHTQPPTSAPPSQTAHYASIEASVLDAYLDQDSPSQPPSPPAQSSRRAHRRATSEESPSIVQNAFARVGGGSLASRPRTMYTSSSTATPAATSASSWTRRPSRVSPPPSHAAKLENVGTAGSSGLKSRERRQKSVSSAAGQARIDDAFFAPSTPPVSSRRPSGAVSTRTVDGGNSIGISVREGNSAQREIGRAVLVPEEGLTVSLRGYTRPEDVEVSWVCVPSVDEGGRSYTTWEMRLRPRPAASSSAIPPLPATPTPPPKATPIRARTPSTTAATFLNYRMSGSSSGTLPPPPAPADLSGMYPPTSTAGSSSDRFGVTEGSSQPPLPPRKLSNRSEGSSQGGSMSSESSMMTTPSTPRRGKLSVSSVATSIMDSHPPFDLEALVSKPSFSSDLLGAVEQGDLPSSRQRTSRLSSYAPGTEPFQRNRQFSIDEEGIMNRAVSFSVGPGVAHKPKSPRHHRFGCYIPPVVQSGGAEFAQLAAEAKRRSQTAGGNSQVVEGVEEEIASSASPAQKVRKASMAAREGQTSESDSDVAGSKGFFASRSSRRKGSLTAPTGLSFGDMPPATGQTKAKNPSPLRMLQQGDLFDHDLETPTKPTFALPSLVASATIVPPPTIPLPGLPADRLSTASDASTTSDSSFAGVGGDISDSEVDDVESASIRLVEARQGKRMLSRWSDTEDGEDEEATTSWGRLPDAVAD
ncbi:hypothetical protein NBRC10513_000846 [Rhodotorula toruloides]|uniref:Uncharacterized protein n=1 Tax=Rhodotorula toruloides TaxID=5286 RepID=A0A0K3CTI7_RHOTO|nr:hypothetical protein AAT19DRAFT_10690 [Rhodotorula toruloides]